MVRNPCILGGPRCHAQRENPKWLPHPCLLGAQKRAEVQRNPRILEGSDSISPNRKKKGRKSVVATSPLPFSGAQMRADLLYNPCILGGPQRHEREKIRIGYLTHVFSRAQKRAKLLPSPRILGACESISQNPQQKERKSEVATSPLPSQRPKRRRNCYITPCVLAGPQRQAHGENQKWLPHFCLVGGLEEGGGPI